VQISRTEGSKEFLSSNEAVAHACRDCGVDIATGYPGTPSTEIIETIHRLGGIEASWSTNEKVALETAIGASFAGARSIATMKHVGLNVAADPLMTLSYTGVKGGLVIVSCDDPNAYSSQNEQDNRNYAKFAKIPMFEPSDAQEAYDFFFEAMRVSEKYDTPVLFRMTTRVSHAKSLVQLGGSAPPRREIGFEQDFDKYVMLPRQARERHRFIEQRLLALGEYSNETPLNRFEPGEGSTLIVAAGVSYEYVREVRPELPVFKVGFSYPMPVEKIRVVATGFEQVICAEELDPFMEELLLIEGVAVKRRDRSFYTGEFSPARVSSFIERNEDPVPLAVPAELPAPAPPALCSGCPNLTILNLFRDLGLQVSGDIGCYTLGALAPFDAIHAVVDMGASIPMATGMHKVLPQEESDRTVAVIGDSTFVHSGITGLVDAVYQRSAGVVCILDNRATAMTGRQGHPGTGTSLQGTDSPGIDYVKLAEAIGVRNVHVIDPYRFRDCDRVVSRALAEEGLSLIVLRRECALIAKENGPKVMVNDNCVRCGSCLRVGCPSISFDEAAGKPHIDEATCIGCGICPQVCNDDAIVPLPTLDERLQMLGRTGT